MRNRWKKWCAVAMAMILGMPGYGLSTKNITTKAEDELITVHIENEERHVQTGETVSLLDGVSVEGSGEESYRAVVGDVQEQDSGLSLYEEGMEELVIPQDAAGKTYRVLYKAQSSMDNEVWNDVEGSEKEALLIVEGSSESEEVIEAEEKQEETEKEEETVEPKTVTIQGEEERTILANEEYDFIKDSDLVVKGPKEEENSYRLKVREVKSPENGSYSYHEGDESFIPKESDEGLVYEVTYVAETSKDKTTWKEVEDVQFIQKLTVAVFKPEEVRGPLATEAILCTGQQFNQFVKNWNSGSNVKVKTLIKADVPSDLMTASLRYKYETISDPSSPVKIYMWHDMNAYGQYVDTVYFGTEVPGATIYTNPNADMMFAGRVEGINPDGLLEKLYDSANPSTPYFFNTSKTTIMSSMFLYNISHTPSGAPFDCTNGNDVSPFGLMDTSNVTDISGMFAYCRNVDLTSIENWNVHKVTNISRLFFIFRGSLPWGIGNWEFDNLQNVEDCFLIGEWSTDVDYKVNMTKWDLSHCDASKLFNEHEYKYNTISRLGVGPKLVDKNGKAFFPTTKQPMGIADGSQHDNGTWQNENTGEQFFEYFGDGFSQRGYTDKNVSWTEFTEKYIANPVAMSGTYVNGKGYVIIAYSGDSDHAKDDQNQWNRAYFCKGLDTTTTLFNNPFTWQYHYFQKWRDDNSGSLYDPGDTITLNKGYSFYATWGANTRNITYDLDGGTNGWANPTTFVAGDPKGINEPTKPGQIFAGWTWTSASKSMSDPWFITNTNTELDDSSHNPDPVRAFPDEDVVLKAHWASPRTITIHGNGGTTSEKTGWPPTTITYTDIPIQFPDVSGAEIAYYGTQDSSYYTSFIRNYSEGYVVRVRGKAFFKDDKSNYYKTNNDYISWMNWKQSNYRTAGLKDGSGTVVLGNPPVMLPSIPPVKIEAPLPSGNNDYYIQWGFAPKLIIFYYNPIFTSDLALADGNFGIINPDGSRTILSQPARGSNNALTIAEYTGKQWDENSPNVTISLKGHETGVANEYVIDSEITQTMGWWPNQYTQKFVVPSFTISSPGSSHTYPTGDLTSYTFTGGFDKDVTLIFKRYRIWNVQYFNLDNTPITTQQTLKEADLPYTFRNTFPPHADWNGYKVAPLGWTLNKYNEGSSTEGLYTTTGNLPTLYRGTWDVTQMKTAPSPLKLYPMYGVDVNNDGIADLFQNKNIVTIKKKVAVGQYSDLTSLTSHVFPYEITFKDVHGDPIKNWPVQDTNGNNYTTDSNGKVTFNLSDQQSISFQGMLPNMILKVVETDPKGMGVEYAISYNGTSFTSGSDTGSITYQDNTPLTVTFKNTAGGNIVPAGIKDTNTRVYVLLGAVLIALAFSIRMLKVRRRA